MREPGKGKGRPCVVATLRWHVYCFVSERMQVSIIRDVS
ncbi:hypothetical protein FBZ84_105386 [Azospirillum baldaniorum]|nr:hypothetical protein FBZ84_105386 [Azospirillum baldaniorum]